MNSKKTKVCHFTSAHDSLDDRIFYKECISLVEAGYEVYIVSKGDSFVKDGINIIGLGDLPSSRIKRLFFFSKKVYKKALELNCEIYHFHDPELLLYAKKFLKKGCKVIYDSHENVPNQILSKPYLNSKLAKIISKVFTKFEKSVVKLLSAVITVTEENVNRFKIDNENVYLVRNFPVLDSFKDVDFSKKENTFVYSGGITKIRGAGEICLAAEKASTEVLFYGPVESDELKKDISNAYTNFQGKISQNVLFDVLKKTSVGFCTLHKVPNYMDSYPIKLFEYMASGMAVIASDIPMWKEIIEKYQCGICVDPTNVDQICDAVKFMKNNPDKVREMGENGRKAVFEHFSWENESKVLLECYSSCFPPIS